MLTAKDWTAIGEEILRDDATAIGARIEAGLDPNQLSDEYSGSYSMLEVAASHGALHVLWCLIDAGADVNKRVHGWTALMTACGSDELEAARVLLDAGADPNIQSGPDDEGDSRVTALMEAANGCHLEMVKLLLSAGADPTMLTRKGRSALNFMGGRRKGRGELVKVLVEAGCPVTGACLTWPAEMSDVETVHYLLKHGADPNAPSNRYEQTPGGPGILPIHLALMSMWMAKDFGGADPEGVKRERCIQVLDALIEGGADVNLESKGLWVIYKSRLKGDREIADLFRRAGWTDGAEKAKPQPPPSPPKPAPSGKPARSKARRSAPLGAKDFMKFLYSSQPDWSVLAVLAPIESVSEAFARYRNAGNRACNVQAYSRTEYRGMALDEVPVIQLRDNPWTVIIRSLGYLSSVELADVPDEARALSEELSTRAVAFMGEDTSGATGYELYENGARVEHAEWDGGGDVMNFESSVREKPDWPKDDIKIADEVLGELGIFVPLCYAEGDDDGQSWLAADKKIILLIERADLIDL